MEKLQRRFPLVSKLHSSEGIEKQTARPSESFESEGLFSARVNFVYAVRKPRKPRKPCMLDKNNAMYTSS